MWNTIKSLLGSKKALMSVLAVVASVAALFGWDLPVDTVALIVSPLWLYVFGQSIADHGKEAALVGAAALMSTAGPTKPPADD